MRNMLSFDDLDTSYFNVVIKIWVSTILMKIRFLIISVSDNENNSPENLNVAIEDEPDYLSNSNNHVSPAGEI